MSINTTFFDFFKIAAVRHLGLKPKMAEISTAGPVRRANVRHNAKCADRSNRCRDILIFVFLKWRLPPSWILEITTL